MEEVIKIKTRIVVDAADPTFNYFKFSDSEKLVNNLLRCTDTDTLTILSKLIYIILTN